MPARSASSQQGSFPECSCAVSRALDLGSPVHQLRLQRKTTGGRLPTSSLTSISRSLKAQNASAASLLHATGLILALVNATEVVILHLQNHSVQQTKKRETVARIPNSLIGLKPATGGTRQTVNTATATAGTEKPALSKVITAGMLQGPDTATEQGVTARKSAHLTATQSTTAAETESSPLMSITEARPVIAAANTQSIMLTDTDQLMIGIMAKAGRPIPAGGRHRLLPGLLTMLS